MVRGHRSRDENNHLRNVLLQVLSFQAEVTEEFLKEKSGTVDDETFGTSRQQRVVV